MKLTDIFRLVAATAGSMALALGRLEHGILPKRSVVESWVRQLRKAADGLEARLTS